MQRVYNIFYLIIGLSILFLAPWVSVFNNYALSAFAALLVCVHFIQFCQLKRGPLVMGRVQLWLLLGWLSLVITSCVRNQGYLDLDSALLYAAMLGATILLSQEEHPFTLEQFFKIASAALLLLFVATLAIRFFEMKSMDWVQGGGRLKLGFGNPNIAAAFLLGLLPAGFVCAQYASCARARLIYWAAGLSCLMLIFMTGSRNGILCSFVLLLAWFGAMFSMKQSLNSKAILGAVAIFASFILIPIALDGGGGVVDKTIALFQGGGASEMGRLTIYQMVVVAWLDSWADIFFGRGFGAVYILSMNFPAEDLFFRLDSVGFRHAHSEPLELLFEGGLVASLCLFAAMVYLFKELWRKVSAQANMYSYAATLSIIGLFGFSTVSVATRYSVVINLLSILVGLSLRNSSSIIRLNRGSSNTLLLLIGLSSVAFMIQAGRGLASDFFLQSAIEKSSTNSSEATEHFRASIRAHPKRITSRYHEFIHLIETVDGSERELIDRKFSELENLISNFKNTREYYAYYLGEIGAFDEAAQKLERLANSSYYKLQYLANAAFYYNLAGQHEDFERLCGELLFRALRAETRGAGESPIADLNISMNVSEGKDYVVTFHEVASSQESRIMASELSKRIPISVRHNQHILPLYMMAELTRILTPQILRAESPRFIELLSDADREKVMRLADKLDELKR